MKSLIRSLSVAISLACFSIAAHAELKVADAWVKPTVPGQPVGAAYMKLTADKNVEIVALSSPVAGKTELHSMSMTDNIMRMKRVDRLALKAGKPVELKPGGYHIMLMALKHQIKEGEAVAISLVTQDESGNKATVSIKAIATAPPESDSDAHMHMHH
ncbi:MAG: copper chaperone PCu(A)C [Methylophilus sp.]